MKSKIDLFADVMTDFEKGMNINKLTLSNAEFTEEFNDYLRIVELIKTAEKPRIRIDHLNQVLEQVNKLSRQELPLKRSLFSKLIPVLASVIALITIGWASMSYSNTSLPGDVLYPVKLAREKIQCAMTFDRKNKTLLHLTFAMNRTHELSKHFSHHGKFDHQLLNSIFNEQEIALGSIDAFEDRFRLTIMDRMRVINSYQHEVLNSIKPLAFSSDTNIINRAISRCCEYEKCLDEMMNRRSTTPQHSCPCGPGSCKCK